MALSLWLRFLYKLQFIAYITNKKIRNRPLKIRCNHLTFYIFHEILLKLFFLLCLLNNTTAIINYVFFCLTFDIIISSSFRRPLNYINRQCVIKLGNKF
jgi:hypothetical protein